MGTGSISAGHVFLSFVLLFYYFYPSNYCIATAMDTLTRSQNISVGETLTSTGQIFELGFFSPGNSGKQYVGIWCKRVSVRKIVWVANREKPLALADSSATLIIGSDGNLVVADGNRSILWSTNLSFPVNNSNIAVLLDQGNLVLKDGVSGEILWESFNHPCDTFLPGMKVGMNTRTGEKRFLSSWKMEDDPSPGKFTVGVSPQTPVQVFVWNVATIFWRSGPWVGSNFCGITDPMNPEYLKTGWFSLVPDIQEGNLYFTFNLFNSSYVRLVIITSTGSLKIIDWDEGKMKWNDSWQTLNSPCDIYGACGPFGFCNKNESPICSCLKGFIPKSNQEWSKGNWTSGCVRQTELLCDKKVSNYSSSTAQNDGFWKYTGMKLPDHFVYVSLEDAGGCELWCLNNCSCLAYVYVNNTGCLIWTGDLLDIKKRSSRGKDLFLRLANSELGKEKERAKLIISFTVISGIVFLGTVMYGLWGWKAKQRGKKEKRSKGFHFSDIFQASRVTGRGNLWRNHVSQEDPSQLPIFHFDQIVAATNMFSTNNKLGEGGFGPVFKGKLQDGREIAVKKLSRCSGQGIEEFKNEILLISKLQHRNLVRLLGCCIEAEELMIVYEYMPNRSLDTLLFGGPERRAQLDWAKRFNIIQGIARGLLYLHRDSCLKIIHRDLKVSNILLDKDMNPKISDFGLARTFQYTQELENTRRVVGTYGYMSPEYALGGIFSEKSDVFSFGVLLLEIICGRKNTSFNYDQEQHTSLLGYAWQLWNEQRALDFMDQELADSFSSPEVLRCIHIGLLCVQDHATDRPTMSATVRMLNSEIDGPHPKQPTFTFQSLLGSHLPSQRNDVLSINGVTVSMVEGR